jgi:hypothetical protein
MSQRPEKKKESGHTLSIALLVRSPLDPLFPLLALRINTFLSNAVLDTAEAGSGVVAFLAGFLAVRTGVLNLSALGPERRLGRGYSRREGIHVHRHPGEIGMHGHRWLDRII